MGLVSAMLGEPVALSLTASINCVASLLVVAFPSTVEPFALRVKSVGAGAVVKAKEPDNKVDVQPVGDPEAAREAPLKLLVSTEVGPDR